ncbi:MAG: hypothetical protein IT440_11475 [Phycisphaeraceae bacterium]|nr:hypothetical protein [Phycisphaeraceae bacterium]
MNSKERIMTALHKGKPDRLPAAVHQWQPYHLQKYMGGISALEACEQCGLDAQIQYFESMGQFWVKEADYTKFSTPQWRDDVVFVKNDPDDRVVHHTITTPGGVLTYKTAGDSKTTWLTEYLIKHDDDVDLIDKYMPVPSLSLPPITKTHDAIGDRGILRGFVWGDQVGCWQHAACLFDINELILRAIDMPDWVHSLMKALLKKKLRFVESMKGAKFDLIETGGGAASSTVISPTLFKEFCLPYDKQIHDALHDLGFLVTYHTCGGTAGIEDLIVANGCDASETCAPRSVGGNQEPWELAAKIAGRVALIGGVDQHNVVTDGSRELIEQTVRKLFETVGRDGGYVCALSDHFFETPVRNLKWFADAARNCVY